MGKKKGKGRGQDEKWAGDDKVPEVSLLEGTKEEEGLTDNPIAPRGGGGKKGKKERKKKAFDDEWEDEIANEPEELGETVGTQLSMEDKSEKGLEEQVKETAKNTPVVAGGGGKKGKRRKNDDDWEGDLARELEELGLTSDKAQSLEQPEQLDKQEAPNLDAKSKAEEQPKEVGRGKKGKKKKKNEAREDDIDALVQEIEKGGGMELGQQQPMEKQEACSKVTKLDSNEDKPETCGGGGGVGVEEEGEEGHTVMTPAQKKAAKREREKMKKEAAKKAKQQQVDKKEDEKTNSKTESVDATPLAPDETSTVKVKGQSSIEADEKPAEEGAVDEEGAVGGEEEDGGEGDEKKKKKKKKKKAEEEKKGKVKKPGKSAILGIKKQIEAMRQEQKRREEEELALQRAEEEAERKRQEELRLEQERKEKKKQKEKERKERRRLEGKPMTKAEKERHAKAQAQLRALEAQGIAIPGKALDHPDSGGEKKKVRYGSRQRPKKPRQEQTANVEDVSDTTSGISEMQDEAVSVASEPTGESVQETRSNSDEEVKDNWDDVSVDEEEGNVKDNWDDESEEEEEEQMLKEKKADTLPLELVKLGQQESVKGVRLESMESASDEGESSSESSEEEESEESEAEDLSPYQRAKERIENRRKRHEEERSADLLRSPVVCVLGHVDTGKTKILDKIRRTHVQDGEAGGITQQIGATFVPDEAIREQTKMVKEFAKTEIKLPGLLIIDTPGHESFSNLRVRGSSMCDIAILVVDVMHGLEPQTLESLSILQKGKTPFVVALNKIDRMFDWRRNPNSGIRETLKRQKVNTKEEFDERLKQVSTEFAEQGLNVALFWEKVNFHEYIPMVPTSAITGDGMGDLIALLVNYSQKALTEQLMLSQELEAMVMEVKVIGGLGTTIDVILRNGILREGDTMILTGTEGPFVSQVRALLMPQPLRELRVKNAYVNHKAIIASQGVKICGKDLEKALAGTPVFVARKQDEVEVFKDEAAAAMKSTLSTIQLQERGVFVQASTLGSLEALLAFLKNSKIPYAGVNIGPVHKKDIMRASVMLEHDAQWAVILAFDVRVERDAQELADSLGVKIFTADIIYHLFDNFLKHRAELREQKRKEYEHIAVFPCRLRILPNCVFNTRDPIVVGVVVDAGVVKPGTPLTVPSKNFTDIGVVTSLEMNHKPVDNARKGMEVCAKIEPTGGEAPRLYGRHFDHTDMLVSKISRESIDAVKNYFREDLQKTDWQLMIDLKKQFQIL